jgi:hypothetical protein
MPLWQVDGARVKQRTAYLVHSRRFRRRRVSVRSATTTGHGACLSGLALCARKGHTHRSRFALLNDLVRLLGGIYRMRAIMRRGADDLKD